MEAVEVLKAMGITEDKIIESCVDAVLCENDSYVSRSVRELVSAKIEKAFDGLIGEKIAEAVDEILANGYQPVDEWGSPKGERTTLRELVQKRAIVYLTEKVGTDGKATTYGSSIPRGEYLAKKAAEDAMSYEVKQELSKSVEAAKAELKSKVANHIMQMLLK